jgi:GDPmannose 4,6-dehydratase
MRALIVGASGQDGVLLGEHLHASGVEVLPIGRPNGSVSGVDIENPRQVERALSVFLPDEVYYLAAHHHSAQQAIDDAVELRARSWAINTRAFEEILAIAVKLSKRPAVFYASSSRIFAGTADGLKDEGSARAPTCAYGLSKAAAMEVAAFFRRTHGLHVACGILFNHESRLRKPHFVSRRVVDGLMAVQRGETDTLELGDLSAKVDWGFAPDYVRAMRLMLAQQEPQDCVIASGQAHSVREMVEVAAGLLGVRWQDCVVENGSLLQRAPLAHVGDASRLRETTGWAPTLDFHGLVRRLVEDALAERGARLQ